MDELLGIAILAYRTGKYGDAIDLLNQVADREPRNWLAKLYLGMSYQRCGKISNACRVFADMSTNCTNEHLRNQAKNALYLIENHANKQNDLDAKVCVQKWWQRNVAV